MSIGMYGTGVTMRHSTRPIRWRNPSGTPTFGHRKQNLPHLPSTPSGDAAMNADHIDHIRSVLNAAYPGWTGPSDPRFVADEIDYKRAAIEKATTRLSDSALTDLIERGRFTEVVERLEEIGKATNLLYLATPRSGDLNILYDPNLDAETFARAIRDLLHGDGAPPARLERYAQWVDDQGLPNRWTFPTYFLFLTHPENNLLVKPHAIGRFLEHGRRGLQARQPPLRGGLRTRPSTRGSSEAGSHGR